MAGTQAEGGGDCVGARFGAVSNHFALYRQCQLLRRADASESAVDKASRPDPAWIIEHRFPRAFDGGASCGSNSAVRQALTGWGSAMRKPLLSTVKARARCARTIQKPGASAPKRRPSLSTPGALSVGAKARTGRCNRAVSACALLRSGVFAEETLLIQWPIGKVAPTKFLPPQHVVSRGCRPRQAALTHRAQFYDLTQEIGLGDVARPQLGGLAASRQPINRGLRLYDLRTREDRRWNRKICRSQFAVGPPALPITAVPPPQFDRNDPSSVGCRNCNDLSCCRCCVRRPFGRETEFMLQS
jgi:hypothetical protein